MLDPSKCYSFPALLPDRTPVVAARPQRRISHWISIPLGFALTLGLAWRASAVTESTGSITALLRSGHYAEAERAARDSLAATERVHGAESREYAQSLDVLIKALRLGGKAGNPEALDLAQRSVRLKEKVYGQDDPELATSLGNLGVVYLERGAYPDARTNLTRALDIRTRVLGPGRPEVARILRLMAELERQEGNGAAAVERSRQALTIMKARLSPGDPEVADYVSALAGYLYNTGDYSHASTLYEEALSTYIRAYGPTHPLVATCQNNLGSLYSELEQKERAMRHYDRALAIRRKVLGRDNPLVATTLVSLANVLQDLGFPTKNIRPMYAEALRIQEKAYGSDNRELGWTLMWLGRIDTKRQAHNLAREELQRALDLQTKVLSANDPDLAWTHFSFAELQAAMQDSASARQSYDQAVAIIGKAYGAIHPDRIRFLNEYASFSVQQGDSTKALDLALESARARADQLRAVSRGLAESQALAYTGFGAAGLDLALSLSSRGVGGEEGASRVWDAVIRSRTLVLDEMASRQRLTAVASADTGLTAMFRAVTAARERYANLLVRGQPEGSKASFPEMVDRARDEMDSAERALAARSEEFRKDEARSRVGWDEVSAAIPANTALVGFAVCGGGSRRRYVALIASRGHSPEVLGLGSCAIVDSLVRTWVDTIATSPLEDSGKAARQAEIANRMAGTALRKRVWDPLPRFVRTATQVFLVPDGQLYRINFAAIPVRAHEYLADSGPLFHVLTCERDALSKASAEGKGLLAIGGPAFDGAGSGRLDAPGTTVQSRRGPSDGGLADCLDFNQARFGPLPESFEEVREVAREWTDPDEVTVLTGIGATESAFKSSAPGKRVLHIATHGFFIDRSHCVVVAGNRGIGGLSNHTGHTSTGSAKKRNPAKASPLLLSGLALAGANRRSDAGAGGDDGILTAQEVASLDLSGVDWAVLSACDTGLGRVQVGEGVLGLQRAFRVAGVRTVIMSLWGVPDRPTRQWMTALYDARFHRGLGTAEAVLEASRTMLRRQRAQARSTNPVYWAGFVAAGDWN